jgi:DNA-binding NtrC family response regulator
MDPFRERDTISAPVDGSGVVVLRNEPVVGLRVYRKGKEFDLPVRQDRFSVGSSVRCDVVVDDPYVSSGHCLLERRVGARMFVRDRKSKNGTFVNGNRVEAAELRVGAILRIGRTTMVAFGRDGRGKLTAIEQLRGEDPGFRRAVELAMKAAASGCNVLILGETGTGKELFARAIHELSPRAAGPFVALNCGAIPHELIGSELFGHEKGAFTGAVSARDGVFVQADGGTLFLDELAELPLDQQPHLLRVLETRVVRRVGGCVDRPVDVRLVAATNRIAGLGTEEAPLRVDLYHRLATVVIKLPPLRERARDVPILVRTFMTELGRAHGPRTISRTTLRALERYPWPGNVRELRQAVQRAMALCPHELGLSQLLPNGNPADDPPEIMRTLPRRRGRRRHYTPKPNLALRPIERVKFDAMLDALDQYGTVRAAAAALGIPKSTFADWLKRFRDEKAS